MMVTFLRRYLRAGSNRTGRIALAAIIIVCLAQGCNKDNGVSDNPGSRTFSLIYNCEVFDIPAEVQDLRVWIPVPLTNGRQRLQKIQVLGNWPYQNLQEPEYGNQFMLFDLADQAALVDNKVTLTVKFLVTRHASRPLRRPVHPYPVKTNVSIRFLAPDRLVPIDGQIAAEARATAGYLPDPLSRSRALYDHITSTLSYDKSGTGWGKGDAIYACDIRKGNCTDFHSLFIGQVRALNIPARFIMGLPLPEYKTEGNIPGYHCWAEFYLPDKGWIPIDSSEAHRHPEKRELFFGGLDEHRVAFTIGRDITLPGSAAEPLNYVIYPYVEIDGVSHNQVKTTFSFRDYSKSDK